MTISTRTPPPTATARARYLGSETALRQREHEQEEEEEEDTDDTIDHNPSPGSSVDVLPAGTCVTISNDDDDGDDENWCVLIREAHLVAEDAGTVSTSTGVITRESQASTSSDDDEDEERFRHDDVVVVVDAQPWKDFVLSPWNHRVVGFLVVVAALVTLGFAVVVAPARNRGGSGGSSHPNQPDDAAVVVVATTHREKDSNNVSISSRSASPLSKTNASSNPEEEDNDSAHKTGVTTVVSPTPSPIQSDPSRVEEFRTHLFDILPAATRHAIVEQQQLLASNFSSSSSLLSAEAAPQLVALDYIVNVVTGFAEVPSDATLIDMYVIKVFHATTRGETWFGYCQTPLVTTVRYDICIIPVTTCDSQTQTFASLEVAELGVKGYLPPEIGSFQTMHTMAMAHNEIEQNLPTEMGLLTHLVHLDVSFNRLSGTVPTTLLTQSPSVLETVHLHNNQLTGTLAPEWAHLHRTLQTLTLHGNQFSGSIPETWTALTNLQHVTLYNNPRLLQQQSSSSSSLLGRVVVATPQQQEQQEPPQQEPQQHLPTGWCERIRTGQLHAIVDCRQIVCDPTTCPCECYAY